MKKSSIIHFLEASAILASLGRPQSEAALLQYVTDREDLEPEEREAVLQFSRRNEEPELANIAKQKLAKMYPSAGELHGWGKAVPEKDAGKRAANLHEASKRPSVTKTGERKDSVRAPRFSPPSAAAAEISILGWPDLPPNGKPYVMSIMDEFTTGCFEHEVNLIQPRPDNWYALAEKYNPQLIFIESAWKGNSGSWQYRVANYTNCPGLEVQHLCEYAREKGIPTIFWNKEDPVHHEKFMKSAELVDHIFTTDINMRESYIEKTGNHRVHPLPFSAQPALHKPSPLEGRIPRACFAGSWYGNRHAERGEAMKWLLEAAFPYGLDIYDRNFGTGNFTFPEKYRDGIKGSLPYKDLCERYGKYRVFLNVNSVTNSPTMFSRRVFELMACGTPVVSTYADGLETMFESDAVWVVNSPEEANLAIHTLMTDDREWRRRSLAGIREVFSKHTYAHRLAYIFDKIGLHTSGLIDPQVSLLAKAQTQGDLMMLSNFANSQEYRNFDVTVECSFEPASNALSISDRIRLARSNEGSLPLPEPQNESRLIGWLDPNAQYGHGYLRDLVNASIYAPDATAWGKSLGPDRFAGGGQTSATGTLWSRSDFLKEMQNLSARAPLSREDIFVIDGNEFSATQSTRN